MCPECKKGQHMGNQRRMCGDCDCEVCGFYKEDFTDPAMGFGGSVGGFIIHFDTGSIEPKEANPGTMAVVKKLKEVLNART